MDKYIYMVYKFQPLLAQEWWICHLLLSSPSDPVLIYTTQLQTTAFEDPV